MSDDVRDASAGVKSVSVVMPARNAAGTIADALRSVLNQDWTDLEVIVVDDGSTDGTADVVRSFADSRARLLQRSAEGLVPALNAGVSVARADWIARMDADDVAHPQRLTKQMELTGACDVIGCGVRIIGAGEGYARYAEWLNALVGHDAIMRERFIESPLAHPTVLVRKRVLTQAGGYRDMGWAEDYDLWLRLAALGARFGKSPDILLDWFDTPKRTSRVDGRYSEEAFLRCKAHHLKRGPVPERCIIWGAGPVGARLARALRGEGVVVERFIDIDPRKIGNVRGGSPITGVETLDPERDPVVLSAVASRGARDLVRAELVRRGFTEGQNFWCTA